jgi:transcriptional regulator with XRE-family HTH domain
MEFSARLREQRIIAGFTQQQVAEKIGVDTTTYAHYESGRRKPDIAKLQTLCSIFNISIEEDFPLVHTVAYPSELLNTLSETKEQVTSELAALELKRKTLSSHDILWETRFLLDKLKAAIDPVQKVGWIHLPPPRKTRQVRKRASCDITLRIGIYFQKA